jgi:hypothetical protein
MTGERQPRTQANSESRIDAALRHIGASSPEPGLEGRILNRLAAARLQVDASPGFPRRLPRVLAPFFGFAFAGLMCVVIVGGSISHSRRYHPGTVPAPPALQLPGTGVGAASAVHPAAPASAPVPAGPAARGRSSHRAAQGRARIAPQARKAPGVAVPAPPASTPQN